MGDPWEALAADPILAARAAEVRAEWRTDEEEWTRAEAERWVHRRSLADLAREYLHRGDTVAVIAGACMFRGTLARVGSDWLQVLTGAGAVDVALSAGVVLRRIERARAGGCRDDGSVATFRARLLEYEASGVEVVVGAWSITTEIHGRVAVGRDHVVLTGDGFETALGRIAWIRPERTVEATRDRFRIQGGRAAEE
jgi:hypothetical protein